jgi:DNA repair exonuclease SbcCD ATPase subunit
MLLPKPSLRLASQLEQTDAAILDKANSLERGCASFREDLRSLRTEISKHKSCKDPTKLKTLREKRDLLKLRVEALEKEHEEFRAQQEKKLSLLEKDLHEKYERMHGLVAYGHLRHAGRPRRPVAV